MVKYLLLFFGILSLNNSVLLGQNYGHWESTDSLRVGRMDHSSVVLPNGNVLVSGGAGEYDILKSCEIYDLKTKKWRLIDSMNFKRFHHKMVVLENGNVLVIGGENKRSCEIYNGNEWRLTDSIKVKRWYDFTVTKLKNGKIIITGGDYQFNELKDCEIFDPKTEKWRIKDSLHYSRDGHTATLLNDGRLLIVGGSNHENGDLKNCEIFDPEKEKWEECASLNIARSGHSAVLLPNGKVFVSGGFNGSFTYPYLRSCEIYDPINDKWILVDSLIYSHARHNSLLINDSTVLISGGSWGNVTWELYDVKKNKSIFADTYPEKKQEQTAHLLTDGTVLNIGGLTWTDAHTPYLYPSNKCEIFFPLTTSINIKDNVISPNVIELFQNYPNPFNNNTIIYYNLKHRYNIKLELFDINGRKIKTLINTIQGPGLLKYHLNENNLPSGIYLISLIIKDKIYTKKIIKIR